jgi:hypothetical protein
VGRPGQDALLGALCLGFLEDEPDASNRYHADSACSASRRRLARPRPCCHGRLHGTARTIPSSLRWSWRNGELHVGELRLPVYLRRAQRPTQITLVYRWSCSCDANWDGLEFVSRFRRNASNQLSLMHPQLKTGSLQASPFSPAATLVGIFPRKDYGHPFYFGDPPFGLSANLER